MMELWRANVSNDLFSVPVFHVKQSKKQQHLAKNNILITHRKGQCKGCVCVCLFNDKDYIGTHATNTYAHTCV